MANPNRVDHDAPTVANLVVDELHRIATGQQIQFLEKHNFHTQYSLDEYHYFLTRALPEGPQKSEVQKVIQESTYNPTYKAIAEGVLSILD